MKNYYDLKEAIRSSLSLNEGFGDWADEFEVNGKKVGSDNAWRDFVTIAHLACLLTQMEKQIDLVTTNRALDLSYSPDGKKLISELKKVNSACKGAHSYVSNLNQLMTKSFKKMSYDAWDQAFKNMKNYASKL